MLTADHRPPWAFGKRSWSEQRAGPFHVVADLGQERPELGVVLLPAQPVLDVHADVEAVEILLDIEDVRLDGAPPPGERRVGAHRDRRREAPRAEDEMPGVYAVGGQRRPLRRSDVRGGEA